LTLTDIELAQRKELEQHKKDLTSVVSTIKPVRKARNSSAQIVEAEVWAQAVEKGQSIDSVAQQAQVTKAAVYRRLKRLKGERYAAWLYSTKRRRRFKGLTTQEIIEAIENGASLGDVAKALGHCKTTIRDTMIAVKGDEYPAWIAACEERNRSQHAVKRVASRKTGREMRKAQQEREEREGRIAVSLKDAQRIKGIYKKPTYCDRCGERVIVVILPGKLGPPRKSVYSSLTGLIHLC